MRFAGIDIGSRSIKFVVMENDNVIDTRKDDTGYDPIAGARKLLAGISYDRIMATGYGRNLFQLSFDSPVITEIKAHAAGARAFYPGAKSVLDIGGQDSKVIAINDAGKVTKFEMNDRCAAGTGKFLEIMAKTLGFELEKFGPEALKAEKDIHISSMCTVFAESEVTSLVARGADRREIARGIHLSAVRRAVSMLKRLDVKGPLVFSGGVANNTCMRRLLEDHLNCQVLAPEKSEFVGAVGAAFLARGIASNPAI